MSDTIAVLGAGAWGTAVAKVIADKGNDVTIWCHSKTVLDDINERHVNSRHLPDVALPAGIRACGDMLETVNGRNYVILARPVSVLPCPADTAMVSPE